MPGPCWLSIAHASGRQRTEDAARSAISAELIDIPIDGATGILYIISGADQLTLHEVQQAADIIRAAASKEANIIFGVTIDPSLGDSVRINLIATGFTSPSDVMHAQKEEEFYKMLKDLGGDESKLGVPAYQRRPLSMRRLGIKSGFETRRESPEEQ